MDGSGGIVLPKDQVRGWLAPLLTPVKPIVVGLGAVVRACVVSIMDVVSVIGLLIVSCSICSMTNPANSDCFFGVIGDGVLICSSSKLGRSKRVKIDGFAFSWISIEVEGLIVSSGWSGRWSRCSCTVGFLSSPLYCSMSNRQSPRNRPLCLPS